LYRNVYGSKEFPDQLSDRDLKSLRPGAYLTDNIIRYGAWTHWKAATPNRRRIVHIMDNNAFQALTSWAVGDCKLLKTGLKFPVTNSGRSLGTLNWGLNRRDVSLHERLLSVRHVVFPIEQE